MPLSIDPKVRALGLACGFLLAGGACTALGQTGEKAKSGTTATAPGDEKSGDASKRTVRPYHRPGGRTNREPTDTRIRGEGVKLPPCTAESRDSIDCPK